MKKIYISSDHAGYNLKENIKRKFKKKYIFLDLGTNNSKVSVNYPDFAHRLCKKVSNDSKNIGILKGIPKIFEATRYHSLIIDKKTLSKDLEITAMTLDGIIMGVKHRIYDVHGVQFHPESIKTKDGLKILKNFIK